MDEEGLFMLNNRVKIRRGRSYEEKNQVLVGKNVLLFTFKKGGGNQIELAHGLGIMEQTYEHFYWGQRDPYPQD